MTEANSNNVNDWVIRGIKPRSHKTVYTSTTERVLVN